MSGTNAEEFVYKLLNVNDNSGYGDSALLCTVKPIVMQRTFEDMAEEGKTVKDFTFYNLLHSFTEMVVNMCGLWTLVDISYTENYLCSEVTIRRKDGQEITQKTQDRITDLLGEIRVNFE